MHNEPKTIEVPSPSSSNQNIHEHNYLLLLEMRLVDRGDGEPVFQGDFIKFKPKSDGE